MDFQPDILGAVRHLIAAMKDYGAASPSEFVHPSIYAAEAAITPPAAETPDLQPEEPGEDDKDDPTEAEPAEEPAEQEPAPAA